MELITLYNAVRNIPYCDNYSKLVRYTLVLLTWLCEEFHTMSAEV